MPTPRLDALNVIHSIRKLLTSLEDMLSVGAPANMPVSDRIIQFVAKHYNLSVDEMKQKCNRPRIFEPKSLAAHFLGIFTAMKDSEIAPLLGYKGQRSVGYAVQRVADRIQTEPKYAVFIGRLHAELKQALQ